MTTIQQARVLVAKSVLGIDPEDFDGTPAAYAKLSQEQQIRLSEGVSRYVSQHPAEFAPAQVQDANNAVASTNFGAPLEDTSIGAQFDQFGREIVSNASNLATGFGVNLSKYLSIAAAVVTIIYLGPVLLARYKK